MIVNTVNESNISSSHWSVTTVKIALINSHIVYKGTPTWGHTTWRDKTARVWNLNHTNPKVTFFDKPYVFLNKEKGKIFYKISCTNNGKGAPKWVKKMVLISLYTHKAVCTWLDTQPIK